MKSAFISLIGRPNAGKSTLLNQILGEKIAITSSHPQTTRDSIKGIYTDADSQMVFVDTPGVHKPNNKLGTFLNREAYYSLLDVDIILFLVDVKKPFGKGDQFILEKIKEVKKPTFLVLNKVDLIKKEELLPLIQKYQTYYDFKEIIPISALQKDGVEGLISTLKKYLVDEVMYYDADTKTDQTLEFRLREIIREKVFQLTEEEIPYSTTVLIDRIETSKTSDHIYASVIVDRESIKRIIVGKNGGKIKEIGTLARIDIEKLLSKKIYLELFVKVIKNWRDKESKLQDLGYSIKKEKD